jgi:hypothetical protein
MVAIGSALLICTCCAAGVQAGTPPASPPTLTEAERVVLRADDIKRLSEAGRPGLAEAFRGRALQVLQAQAQALGRRGQRFEERSAVRELVLWDPRSLEAVLQVTAQRRLVTPDDPDPSWAATVRQWWVRLELAGGRWWIADQRDLTPDAWRPAVRLTGWVHSDI